MCNGRLRINFNAVGSGTNAYRNLVRTILVFNHDKPSNRDENRTYVARTHERHFQPALEAIGERATFGNELGWRRIGAVNLYLGLKVD